MQKMSVLDENFNPMDYGILSFSRLREGGIPHPRKQGYNYFIDLKFATDNY